MTFYKLNTIRPCSLEVFLEFVQSRGVEATDDGSCNPLEFTDETDSIYRIKLVDSRVKGYVSFDGTITVKPRRLEFHQIVDFVKFCSENDLGVRRGNVEIVGPGNLASDIFSSEAHRIAIHMSENMDS